MQIIKKKNIIHYLRLVIFFVIVAYLLFKADYNLNQIYEKINTGFYSILLIIFLHILHLNFVNIRMFLVFKLGLKKFIDYFSWMKLYFESLGMNIVLSHTGTAYRAYELKKNGIQYRSFLSFFYILFFSYLIFNMIFILLELIIFLDGDPKLKLYYISLLIFVFVGFLILPIFLHKLFNFLRKKIMKNFFDYIYKIQNSINLQIKKILYNKNILKVLFGFGFINHIFEISLFYFSFNVFLGETAPSTLILLFGLSFILDRIPIIRDIPGFSEILFATASIPFGFDFTYSLLTKFLLRFTGIISLLFNYVLSLIISDFLYKKIK
tara:strand:+ start:2389 stop:3357 length:969 start_codon:yes stop_codon:yes gene_type:complete